MSRTPYSPELREKIAKEYFEGNASSIELANKYNIPSDNTVRVWAQNIENKEYLLLLKNKEMLIILLDLKPCA